MPTPKHSLAERLNSDMSRQRTLAALEGGTDSLNLLLSQCAVVNSHFIAHACQNRENGVYCV